MTVRLLFLDKIYYSLENDDDGLNLKLTNVMTVGVDPDGQASHLSVARNLTCNKIEFSSSLSSQKSGHHRIAQKMCLEIFSLVPTVLSPAPSPALRGSDASMYM